MKCSVYACDFSFWSSCTLELIATFVDTAINSLMSILSLTYGDKIFNQGLVVESIGGFCCYSDQ